MNKYAAFLRGINLGKRQVKMGDLKIVLEEIGLENVKTLLASGNVIFESNEKDSTKLRKRIEAQLKSKFGFKIDTILRSIEEIEKLVKNNPFRKIEVNKDTRLYVTFFGEKQTKKIKSDNPNFQILRITEDEICTVLTLDKNGRTLDLMNILEKEYGKNVTTRNWNTVLKILKK